MIAFTISKQIVFTSEESTRAEVEIKIGEGLHILGLEINSDKVLITRPATIVTLEQAGLSFDFRVIIEEYRDMVKNQDAIIIQQKKIRATEIYNKHWTQIIQKPEIEGVSYKSESLENWIERSTTSVWNELGGLVVLYKEKEVKISQVRAGSRLHGPIKYSISDSITEYKTRNYGSFESAVKKIVELVDESIERAAYQAEQKIINDLRKSEKLANLNSLFGNVIEKKEYKYSGRGSRGYDVTSYYIVKGEKKIKIDSVHNDEETFVLAGLGKLSVKQINSIIEII